MRSLATVVLAISIAFAVACGSDETNDPANNPNNQSDMSEADDGVDICANVGIASPPLCSTGCQEPCGCSSCDIGETGTFGGMAVVCTEDGCFEPVSEPDMGDEGDMALDMNSTDAGVDMQADMQADAGASACQVGINTDNSPTDTCSHGAADWIAFRWTAPANLTTIDSIELHTDEGEGAFLEDDAGQPGAVLFQGMLSTADVDGWRTFDTSTSVAVTGGNDYWIAENVTTCSVADAGPELEYRTADALAGPWSEPFMAHSWTARVNGTCP